jgi:hypothetical protein
LASGSRPATPILLQAVAQTAFVVQDALAAQALE